MKWPEDKDEYLTDHVFWVPKAARWSHLQANAKQPAIGTPIDDAMRAIEKNNESLNETGTIILQWARSIFLQKTPLFMLLKRPVLGFKNP